MKLYTYYRSSASYRVRIALALKNLSPEHVPVNLLKGEQKEGAYGQVNPQHLLPALVTDAGETLTQSLAIIEYLEEAYPTPALLPKRAEDRARVRALALSIACEVAPLNNLGTLKYLTDSLGVDEDTKNAWYAHWVAKGLSAFEALLAQHGAGQFCFGDGPSMADCILVPQLYNARRFNCDLSAYPKAVAIDAHCASHPAFIVAHPENQTDTP